MENKKAITLITKGANNAERLKSYQDIADNILDHLEGCSKGQVDSILYLIKERYGSRLIVRP